MVDFKSELVRYRKAIEAQSLVNPDRDLAFGVVDRWMEHSARETLWDSVVAALGPEAMPSPANLIDLVIERRIMAAELERVESGIADGVDAGKRLLKRSLSKGDFGAVAAKATQISDAMKLKQQILGRQKGGYRRRYFILAFSDKFEEFSGTPRDDIVGPLVEIAFGEHGLAERASGDGHNAVEEVREARRRASGKRDTRPQK